MLKKIALATITAAALVAPPSLVYACNKLCENGVSSNGIGLNSTAVNALAMNGYHVNRTSVNGLKLNAVEPAGREVYFVSDQTNGESTTVLTIELPQDRVTR